MTNTSPPPSPSSLPPPSLISDPESCAMLGMTLRGGMCLLHPTVAIYVKINNSTVLLTGGDSSSSSSSSPPTTTTTIGLIRCCRVCASETDAGGKRQRKTMGKAIDEIRKMQGTEQWNHFKGTWGEEEKIETNNNNKCAEEEESSTTTKTKTTTTGRGGGGEVDSAENVLPSSNLEDEEDNEEQDGQTNKKDAVEIAFVAPKLQAIQSIDLSNMRASSEFNLLSRQQKVQSLQPARREQPPPALLRNIQSLQPQPRLPNHIVNYEIPFKADSKAAKERLSIQNYRASGMFNSDFNMDYGGGGKGGKSSGIDGSNGRNNIYDEDEFGKPLKPKQQHKQHKQQQQAQKGEIEIPFTANRSAASERFSIHHYRASGMFNSDYNLDSYATSSSTVTTMDSLLNQNNHIHNNNKNNKNNIDGKQKETTRKQLQQGRELPTLFHAADLEEEEEEPPHEIPFVADKQVASERLSIYNLKASQQFQSLLHHNEQQQEEEVSPMSYYHENNKEDEEEEPEEPHDDEDGQQQEASPCADDQEAEEVEAPNEINLLCSEDIVAAVIKRVNQVKSWEKEEEKDHEEKNAKDDTNYEEKSRRQAEEIEELYEELEMVKQDLAKSKRELEESTGGVISSSASQRRNQSSNNNKRGAKMLIKKWKSYAKRVSKKVDE